MNTQAAGTQQAHAPFVPVKNTHTAKLVRGEVYFLGNTRFDNGVEVTVPQYIKDHLEKVAVDFVDVEEEAEARQKFEFAELPEPGAEAPIKSRPVAAPGARLRGRATPAQRAAELNQGGEKIITT